MYVEAVVEVVSRPRPVKKKVTFLALSSVEGEEVAVKISAQIGDVM